MRSCAAVVRLLCGCSAEYRQSRSQSFRSPWPAVGKLETLGAVISGVRSKTGWAEFNYFLCYFKMVALRVSRFVFAGQGERRLWERIWSTVQMCVILCSCVIATRLLVENWQITSLGCRVRVVDAIIESILELAYRKISWFVSIFADQLFGLSLRIFANSRSDLLNLRH